MYRSPKRYAAMVPEKAQFLRDVVLCKKIVLLNVLLLPDHFAYMMHHCYKKSGLWHGESLFWVWLWHEKI